MIEIVPARASHLRYLAANLRQSDLDEIDALSGASALSALSFSYRRASICMVALIDGKPEAIWGAGSLNVLAGSGSPWMVCSDRATDDLRFFLRMSVDWRDQLLSRYSVLRNVVDCRNAKSIRWLKWLGFKFSAPFEARGHDVMIFEMRSKDVR